MNDARLKAAVIEARRFLDKVSELEACRKPVKDSERSQWPYKTRHVHDERDGCPETAAVRRASMDLTRALAKLRAL